MTPTNASFLQPDTCIHALLIGPSGSGKTAAAISFPGPTTIIDFDDRAKGAILGCEFLDEKRKRGEVDIYKILSWNGNVPNSLAEVYQILDAVDRRVSKKEVANVIIDSTTSMRTFFVNDSINAELKGKKKDFSIKHFKVGEAVLSQKQDYNYAMTCMRNILYENLKTFRCNVFVTTHIRDKVIASPTAEEPERTIVVGQTITAPGQLTIEIPSWFDEVWEFETDCTIRSEPPKYYVTFKGSFAHTSMRLDKHKLDITGKSLYEVLRPYMEKMK